MKKLLIAPFLLASLFSFGGESKAYPNSRYDELNQNSRRNVNSLKLQNSNSKIYLLNYAVVLINQDADENRYITGSMYSPFISYFQDSISCQRAILSLRNLLKSFYSKEGSYNFKTYFSCTASESNDSDEIPRYYNFPLVFIEGGAGKNKSRIPGFPLNIPVPFAKVSTCNSYGRNLRNTIRGWDINPHTDERHKWRMMYVCIKTSNL